MAGRDFLKTIDDACDASLVDLGFERPRKGTLYIEIKDGFLGWVGLNVGNHGNRVRINPNIGIHCVPIEKLCADLFADKSRPYKKGSPATYALPLGSQTPPDVEVFDFFEGSPVSGEARRLSILIGEYGVPWMTSNASYNALIPLLEEDFAALPNHPHRLAGAYLMSGQAEKARSFTHDVLARFELEYPGPMYDHFYRFAIPFLKRLES